MFDSKISEGRLSDVIKSSLDILSLIIILWMRTCTRNGWMKNERRKTSVSTRMMMKGEYGYIFRTERMKRKWNYWIWWLMRVKSSMKWQRTTSWMKYVIILFHHHHGIYPHMDTGWGTQDTQSHQWSIRTPSYHSQGSYRWLAKWISEVVHQWCGRTRNGGKWICLQWMDRIPYRNVSTMDIRWIQTPNTFHPWTISCQSQYRWQQVPTTMSHSGEWRWAQDHCKS